MWEVEAEFHIIQLHIEVCASLAYLRPCLKVGGKVPSWDFSTTISPVGLYMGLTETLNGTENTLFYCRQTKGALGKAGRC